MQTMIGGMAKLSMITRRNAFYGDMLKKSDEMAKAWKAADDKLSVGEPMFARSEEEARLFFKDDFRKIDPIDQAQTLTVGNSARASNPFGDAKPVSKRSDPFGGAKPVSKKTDPFGGAKPVAAAKPNPFGDAKPVSKKSDPFAGAKPVAASKESSEDLTAMFGTKKKKKKKKKAYVA